MKTTDHEIKELISLVEAKLKQPLMATNHVHGNDKSPVYIIGRRHGLSALRKIVQE